MDINAYLQRISYGGSRLPTAETLRRLHRAHMISVPFENLDIHLGRAILLDEARLFKKIVHEWRGGFCYELNGLFAALLRELGFTVDLLSARVFNEKGEIGPPFDHMTLLVHLQQRWLADVGFGDSFSEPLRLDDPGDQFRDDCAYRLTSAGDTWTLWERLPDADWEPQYLFPLMPRHLADFVPMCHYHQTSPDSHFTRKRICSRATTDGRVTLSEMRLIITTNGERRERVLTDPKEYAAALRDYFNISLAQ